MGLSRAINLLISFPWQVNWYYWNLRQNGEITNVYVAVTSQHVIWNSWLLNTLIVAIKIVATLQTPYKHTTCISRWNDVETVVSTSCQRGTHVCLQGMASPWGPTLCFFISFRRTMDIWWPYCIDYKPFSYRRYIFVIFIWISRNQIFKLHEF